ncbi:MAG: hypothetical protein U0359_06035 [Byssovorax sp.]
MRPDPHPSRPDPRHHVDISVSAVPGERRVVAYRLLNGAATPITVVPGLSPVHDLVDGGHVAHAAWAAHPGGPVLVPPGGALEVRVMLETTGLLLDHAYGVELTIDGARVEPVRIVVTLEQPPALQGRHDPSRLRAFIEGHCFAHDATALVAPGQHLHGTNHGCHTHGCHGHDDHGHPTGGSCCHPHTDAHGGPHPGLWHRWRGRHGPTHGCCESS